MKALLLLTVPGLILAVSPVRARSWVVDNDTSRPADFRSAQAAHDGAAAGDTLLFVGSGLTYGELTMSKTLHLAGPGYFYSHNNIAAANPKEATLRTIFVTPASTSVAGGGASGSTFRGLAAEIQVKGGTRNVLVDQCWLHGFNCGSSDSPQKLVTQGIIVRRCFIANAGANGGSVLFQNCKIDGLLDSSTAYGFSPPEEQRPATITANFCVVGRINCHEVSNLILQNSILIGNPPDVAPGIQISGSVLFSGAANHPGNRSAADYASVFQSAGLPVLERDNQLNASPSNPAKGAAVGGGDAGMFAGATPYTLSGIPALPRVSYLSTSGVASDTTGLRITAAGEVRE